MSWRPPYTTKVVTESDTRYLIEVYSADGQLVATGICLHNTPAKCAMMGEITLTAGGPLLARQKVVVILIRAALARGKELGIQTVSARVLPAMKDLVQLLSPRPLKPGRSFDRLHGDLDEHIAHIAAKTDPDGGIKPVQVRAK